MPEGAGLYFSWGNIDGHPEGAGYRFNAATYADTPGRELTGDIPLENDAARSILGEPWRMPSKSDFDELNANCSSVWTTLNGVYGRLFTSNINGEKIFLPACGEYDDLTLTDKNVRGYYWDTGYVNENYCRILLFSSANVTTAEGQKRESGCCIRPVCQGTPNRSVIPPTPEDDPKEEETPTTEEPKDDNER